MTASHHSTILMLYTRVATVYDLHATNTRIATVPSVRCTASVEYVLDILVQKLIWWLTLCGLSVQVSCLMVFTVHGIVPPSCAVCTSLGSALGITYSLCAVHIPYTVKTMRQLLHVIPDMALGCSCAIWLQL